MKTTLEMVLDALRDIVNPDISDDQKVETLDDLGLDSLDYVEICMYLEEDMNTTLSEFEEKIRGDMTVEQLAEMIDTLKK